MHGIRDTLFATRYGAVLDIHNFQKIARDVRSPGGLARTTKIETSLDETVRLTACPRERTVCAICWSRRA